MLKRILVILFLVCLTAYSAEAFYSVRYRSHATDCTLLTDGKLYDYCFEIDSDDVYKCQPTSGDCNTSAEWRRIGNYSTVQLHVVDYTTTLTTGDGKLYFSIPARLNGSNLVAVTGQVITTGTVGTTTVQLARCANAATGNACSSTVSDMLSTKLTIDASEDSSDTAAIPSVVNQTYDDVSTNQVIRVDVDVVSTGSQGLILNLTFLRI